MEHADVTNEEKMNKLYIGDGVYVEFFNEGLILTTENGFSVTNKIVLEHSVLSELQTAIKNERMLQELDAA